MTQEELDKIIGNGSYIKVGFNWNKVDQTFDHWKYGMIIKKDDNTYKIKHFYGGHIVRASHISVVDMIRVNRLKLVSKDEILIQNIK
jgi:hypothetical protein